MSQDEIRIKILDSARERFTYFGYKKTTVEEIASDSGISVGAVYLHYKNKQELLFATLIDITRKNLDVWKEIAGASKNSLDKIDEMVKYWIHETSKTKKAMFGDIFLENALSQDGRLRFLITVGPMMGAVLISTIEQGKKNGEIRQNVDAARLATIILKQIRFMIILATEGPDFNWRDSWHSLWEFICRGIR